ncbi:shikimate kinase [Acetitomaculum ruminis DSM 5522]|uniref:Shikimate kinase n=1 Tax=Acetitomaculum ruminis DSM 5522 TaxID=1120918 RepID=A0A1I0YF31_9FIRM|nr:shikimate kinase [Acetitomaculum ruminis]SFB10978.1 shikimate kinase [Acetitomaculum ruminis DSM 5522]
MSNIVLIGMPGVGKSTAGVVLAKLIGYNFIDTDLLIQEREHRLLSEIIANDGIDAFLRIEGEVNSAIETDNSIISTGGSVVYVEKAMEHLRKIGKIVYLKLSYETLESRLSNIEGRGVVLRKGQTLRDLYEERTKLYEKYAHYIVDEEGLDVEETIKKIEEVLGLNNT